MRGVDEILSFLVKAWSRDNSIKYKHGDIFQCNPEENFVMIPDFHGDKMPNLTGLSRWRVWRFTTFHESMHMLLSPKNKYKFVHDIICDYKLNGKVEHSFVSMVMSVIEDRRIEVVGLEEYVGYVDEREFVLDIGREESKMRKDLIKDIGRDLDDAILALEKFSTAVLYEMEPDGKDDDEQKFLNDVVATARKVRSVKELEKATGDITTKFYERYGELPDVNNVKSLATFGIFETSDEMIENISGRPDDTAINDVKTEYGEIKKEIKMIEEIDNEIKKQLSIIGEDGSPGRLQPKKCDYYGDFSELLNGTQTTTNKLISYLRNWKVGWEETQDYYGDNIDVEEYILGRMKGRFGKFFLTEDLISQKTDMSIVIDMSGSIRGMEKDYMRAMTIIGEALNYIGTKFSIYVFRSPEFIIVKTLQEPWSRRCVGKLAGIKSNGGTPLSEALKLTDELRKIEGFKRIVIITDGKPNSPRESTEMIKRIESSGTSISILGIEKYYDSMDYSDFFKMVGYKQNRVKMLNNIDDLPMVFFDLLRHN